jgi:hypothetical protein
VLLATLPLINSGEAETTPRAGALTATNESGKASHGQPGASDKLNENAPPRPGTFCEGGEIDALQSVGELKSIFVTKDEK